MTFGLTKPSLPIFTSLASFALTLGLTATILWGQKLNPPENPSSPSNNPAVLGSRSGSERPAIYVSGDKWGYNGGVISLASTDQPEITITSYHLSGDFEVKVYPASKDILFAYLSVDDKNQQQSPLTDVTGLTPIATHNYHLVGDESRETPLTLPLDPSGVWLVTVSNGQIRTDAFIIRSLSGILTKEGDNQFIFWAQNFQTRRSSPGGSLTLYSLTNQPQALTTVGFSDQGIATAALTTQADVAWYENGQDVALVPLNLQYLNYDSSYNRFQPKSRNVKYFVFTDRPLYKPGDTLNFKAVIRDDDDARYTLPQGQAQVEIYRGYGEDREIIYSQSLPINQFGTISGQVDLPDTVKTDWYTLTVNAGERPRENGEWWYSPGSSTGFQIQYYRKPDYFLTVNSNQDEYIAGDTINYTISGQYFFGQPLTNKNITYTVRSSDYYEYSYLQDKSFYLEPDYRYGGWYGDRVSEGTVTLDDQGQAQITLPATANKSKSAVYSLTARLEDETGTADEAAKNILVYSGEFGLYRTEYSYGYPVGSNLSVPIQAISRQDQSVANQKLSVEITRKWWEKQPIQEGEKYPRYLNRTEVLPAQSLTTNQEGQANITFIPQYGGIYEIVVSGIDVRGNTISQTFNLWVTDHSSPTYYSSNPPTLKLSLNQQKALPGDSVTVTLDSEIPDRDVFLSLDRARVNRYQIVSISGNSAQIDIPLVDTDMPNIYFTASSFSSDWLDSDQVNLPILTTSQKLSLTLIPHKAQYSPGDNLTLDLIARDGLGNPVSAEIAVWAVDKALFELVSQSNLDIFTAFWKERYQDTVLTHSLEGIVGLTAEQGGGCFASGTSILMSDYTSKPIESVKPGDKIITRLNPQEPKLVAAKVISTHQVTVDGYFVINNSLKVTANHRLFINGSWHEAKNIQIGDKLLSATGSLVTVDHLRWQQGKFTVYNLTVDQLHTFFADGVWVHNKGDDRTVFKDTAYWNPKVYTDSEGKAQVTFKLPDNLTTWTIAALGASVETIAGDNKTDVIVSKPVIVRPSLPNLIRLGDTLEVSALIHNYTDLAQTFTPNLIFDAGTIDASPSALTIPSQGFASVSWKVTPNQEKIPAKFTFSAVSTMDPQASDTITQTLPIYHFGFYHQTGTTGQGNHTYTIPPSTDIDPEKSSLTLSLASTLTGTLPQAMEYLVNYPYGCVEQTISRFIPVIIAAENQTLYASALEGKNPQDMVTEGLKRLTQLQNADGGWGWWFGTSDPFITAYVVESLVRAQKAGFDSDLFLLDSAKQYFQSDTYQTKSNTKSGISSIAFTGNALAIKYYALSLLDEAFIPTQSLELNSLDPDILPLAVMANLKAGITDPSQNGLSLLISRAQTTGDSLYWVGGERSRFASTDGTTALSLKALILGNADHQTSAQAARYLINNRRQQYWSNTFATAQVIDALTYFSQSGNELTPNYTYTVTLNNQSLASGKVNQANQKIKDITIPLPDPTQTHQLNITLQGEGQLYSTLINRSFYTDINSPAESNNLTLTREYLPEKGPGYNLALGDTVTVKLTLEGLSDQERYALIEDELPAGLIPINPEFKNESGTNPTRSWWHDSVSNFEYTQTGVILSLDQVFSDTNTYSYQARVINAGTFLVPPARAELMYSPEVNARTAAKTLTIDSESIFDPTKVINPDYSSSRFISKPIFYLILLVILILITAAIIYLRRRQKLPLPPTPPPQTPIPQP